MSKPEEEARQQIDATLSAAGWHVQDYKALNLSAALGVAIREFPLKTGPADYLLFVERQAAGVIEAKAVGATLSGVEGQAARYSDGLRADLRAWHRPLPFLYQSTGVETFFTDGRDPEPRSRPVFAFHQPQTLLKWARATHSLRAGLRALPPLNTTGLWGAQIEAVTNLEASLAADRPRALVQMATGSGKTFTAVSSVYRLIKFGGAQRVLFLVDRANLGRQALKEFQQYVTPDDGRKFTELYNVQHLTSNTLDPVNRVVITTIQRLYSMLSGEPDYDPTNEEQSLFELDGALGSDPKRVRYNAALPPETFDIIVIDECHRSIYNLWRQVVEYFDAHLIGLTATPAKQTLGFFHQNLVMEYARPRAVLDGVNVDGQVYRIRTQITEQGSTIEAGFGVTRRDRRTRQERWEALDEDFAYTAQQLDRDVLSESQIRTVIRTFRDKLFTEIFPGRTEVPKTLVFAKDDSHAEEIVRIVREEFGRGNAFCQKITYRTTEGKPEDLITALRNQFFPRIAVTVDMIATGTDVKALEILLFMRTVRSRGLFEQMLGRGTRVINATDLQSVTPDATRKTHFVIVDAVGVVDTPKFDTQTIERKRSVSLDKLLQAVALGVRDEDTLLSLAGRLARLQSVATGRELYDIAVVTSGRAPRDLATALYDALDSDAIMAHAQEAAGAETPTAEAYAAAEAALLDAALAPFDDPRVRQVLVEVSTRAELIVDQVSVDHVREAGFSAEDTARARATVTSFRAFIEEHRDEITALQVLYSRPYGTQRVTFRQVQELAERLQQPPHTWTTEALWQAYAQIERDRVRGVGGRRVLTDVVALVRHALYPDEALAPYPELVAARYRDWLAAQAATGRAFTPEQVWWLDRIAEHIGVSVAIEPDDLDTGEFFKRGGRVAAARVLGPGVAGLLAELNAACGV